MKYILYGDKGTGAFCVEAALTEAAADCTRLGTAFRKSVKSGRL